MSINSYKILLEERNKLLLIESNKKKKIIFRLVPLKTVKPWDGEEYKPRK